MHGFGVVEGQHDEVVPIAGFGSAEPDSIFPEIGGDERNYFL